VEKDTCVREREAGERSGRLSVSDGKIMINRKAPRSTSGGSISNAEVACEGRYAVVPIVLGD
jgi:hypothetical protein